MSNVIEAIDAGHVASDLTNAGGTTATSKCKHDNEKWPCDFVVAARSRDKAKRGT